MADTTTAVSRTAPQSGPPERLAPLRPMLWRLHFLTGFLAAPIVVWLCLTGMLVAWNPQIESVLHREALTASSEGEPRPLSEQLAAVSAAYPDQEVVEILPAARAGETTGIVLQPRGAQGEGFGHAPGAFTAYVDPGSATITGRIDESKRPLEWLRNLHSNFRLGEGGLANTLTELAASLVLVSLLTGLYLWWPRTRSALRRAFVPRLRGLLGGRRRAWRDFHSAVGVIAFAAVTMMVVTGLTWTEYTGRWVKATKNALVKESPFLRTDLAAGAARGADDAGGHAGHGGATGGAGESVRLDDVDRIAAFANHAGVPLPYAISPPDSADRAWTVKHLDSRWPVREFSVAIDSATGDVVDRVDFSDQPLLEQATTLGIGFHQAELFGFANQIGLTLLALTLLVLVISGYVTWWRRRPSGAFGAPPKAGPLLRTVPVPLLVGFAAILVLLPTLGVAFVAYLLIERIFRILRRPCPAA